MSTTPPPPPTPATEPSIAGASSPAVALPRWAVQTGFFQRRQPAFWLFVVLLVLATLTVVTEQLLYLQYFPAGWIFSIVLLGLYVVPVALAIYVLDLYEREPLSLLLAAFLWGGVVSIAIAGTANTAVIEILAKVAGPNFAQAWGAAVAAPPVEEAIKYLGVVVIYLVARTEMDDLLDGFVYGAMVGLGFAAVENIQYFIQAVASAGGGDQVGPVLGMFFLRGILVGAYMHVLWTGLTGLGFAYYVTQRHEPHSKRLLYAAGLFVLGVVAHFIWNSPWLTELLSGFGGILLFGFVKGLPFLGFLVVLVVLAQRREHRWFHELTAGHVGTDVITQAELADLGGLRSRWRARRLIATRKGGAGGKLHGQLQREQINLAMIRARAGRDDDPSVIAQIERIRALRAQLDALPDVAQPQAYAPAAGMPPAAPPAIAGWVPTHVVPASGMAAWDAPDPARPPVVTLAAGVQLAVIEERGAWARVMGSNGWTGWVDARLLVRMG